MPKINVKLTPRAIKKWGFIVLVLLVLSFVLIRSQRDSAFREAKKAFNEQSCFRSSVHTRTVTLM